MACIAAIPRVIGASCRTLRALQQARFHEVHQGHAALEEAYYDTGLQMERGMKHPQAQYIKAFADDEESVQKSAIQREYWMPVNSLSEFDDDGFKFRMTPKPVYFYMEIGEHNVHCQSRCSTNAVLHRQPRDNIRLTYIYGKLANVELITEGDGK